MSSDVSQTPPEREKPAAKTPPKPPTIELSWKRKLLFGLIVTAAVFLLLELGLYFAGVVPISEESDPFAGFSNRFPLFRQETTSSGEEVLATAPNRLSHFNPQTFPARKSPDSFRIFCLGGSTTYGRPYDDQTSFCGFLRAALPEMDPARKWEVLNAGGISYASPRIALLMRELAEYQPDLFIVYTGHNEFLEDRTFSSLIETPETVRDLGGWVVHSRIGSVLHRLIHETKPSGDKESSQKLDEVTTRLDRSVGPDVYHRDDDWKRDIIGQFRENLEEIVSQAQAVGADVIFVTPASNLRHCTPFKSEHRNDLTAEELRAFQTHFQTASSKLEENNPKEALDAIDRALEIDKRYAAAHYLRGEILLKAEQYDESRLAFTMAREEDVCPLRANREIIQIVREVADERDLPLIDFVEQIDSVAENHIPGSDWFLDHVHPTIAGHRLLAESLCNKLADLNLATPEAEWDSAAFQAVADEVESQIDQQKQALALKNLAKVLSWAGKVDEADRLAAKASEMLPNDAETLVMAGFAAERENRLQAAERFFQQALEQDPDNTRALLGMGNVFSLRGDHESARRYFADVTKRDPDHAPAWFNLGNALRNQGRMEQAAEAYQEALKRESGQPDYHKNLGMTLVALGDLSGAVEHFKSALKLDPHSPQRQAELGLVLIDAGQPERAKTQFQNALTIDPETVPALLGMALLHEQQGNRTEAAALLRKALTIDPENPHLQQLLDRVTGESR